MFWLKIFFELPRCHFEVVHLRGAPPVIWGKPNMTGKRFNLIKIWHFLIDIWHSTFDFAGAQNFGVFPQKKTFFSLMPPLRASAGANNKGTLAEFRLWGEALRKRQTCSSAVEPWHPLDPDCTSQTWWYWQSKSLIVQALSLTIDN